MVTVNKNQITGQLKSITTESLAKFLPWIAVILIIIFLVFFSILVRCYGLALGDGVNSFLSSVIAVFAFVEGFSTYLQVRQEKDRIRLQEIRDELEKVYGPLYSIFYDKPEYKKAKEFIFINSDEKSRIDNIMIAFPFLLEPLMLDIWHEHIRNLQPYKTEPTTIFKIPMFFVSHVTIPYDNLTDEYHKRVGKEVMPEPSFIRRLRRPQL